LVIRDVRRGEAHSQEFVDCGYLLPGLNLDGIDWVIVGGESGPGARPMDPGWVLEIRDQCLDARVPFFFKQWGGTRKKKAGRELDGRTWDEMPSLASVLTLV
jgi:protein gp37